MRAARADSSITGADRLPHGHVIHCLGPVYGRDEPAADLLAACYRVAHELAERNALASIAFPAISTGAFGYPLEPATRDALTTVRGTLPSLTSVKHIRFGLYDAHDL